MRCCLASPTACDPQLDRRTGLSSSPRACTSGLESTVMGNLLIVPPTAIGLLPPPFFLMAHSLALHSIGTANCGTSPLSMTLTRSVKANRRHDPASAEPWATNERRWPGWRPSGPPELQHEKTRFLFEHLLPRRLPELKSHHVGREDYKVFWGRRVLFLQGSKCISVLRR